MSDGAEDKGIETIDAGVIEGNKQAAETIQRLLDVAQPHAVFKEPVKVGDQVVIPANELSVGLGIGFGGGSGTDDEGESGHGGGGGGGGGGGCTATSHESIALLLALVSLLGCAAFLRRRSA